MCILFVCTLGKVVSYYDKCSVDVSDGFKKKKFGWGGCWWVVSFIQFYFEFF